MKTAVIIFSKSFSMLLCLLFLGVSVALAHGEEVQIGVQAIFPENQRNREVGFFDLVLEKGATQVIELEISNLSQDKSVVVLIERAAATTDNGGVVHYVPRKGEEAERRESKLPFSFEELVSVSDSIELEPGEVRIVPITIQMPDVPFDGVIAGGFGIRQEIDLDAAREEAGLILNLFNFEMPVLLRQNENVVQPQLQILEVSASQWNLRNIIAVHLENPQMMFINLMEIQAYVKDEATHQVLYEHHVTGFQVAPNSDFVFGIPLNGELFAEGNYILEMEATARNGAWSFTEHFTIESSQAESLNRIAAVEEIIQGERTGSYNRVVLLLIVSGTVMAVMSYIFIVHYEKRKHKEVREAAVKKILKEIGDG